MVVRIGGAEQLRDLARRSHRFASGDYIIAAVQDAIEGEVPALENGTREEAMRILPGRNGLNRLVALSRYQTKVARRRGSVRVTIRALPSDKIKDPAAVNRGRLLHPTYGHKPRVIQPVRPGWFTVPMVRGSRQVRAQIQEALSTAARRF